MFFHRPVIFDELEETFIHYTIRVCDNGREDCLGECKSGRKADHTGHLDQVPRLGICLIIWVKVKNFKI